jgi:hypothetical protein
MRVRRLRQVVELNQVRLLRFPLWKSRRLLVVECKLRVSILYCSVVSHAAGNWLLAWLVSIQAEDSAAAAPPPQPPSISPFKTVETLFDTYQSCNQSVMRRDRIHKSTQPVRINGVQQESEQIESKEKVLNSATFLSSI